MKDLGQSASTSQRPVAYQHLRVEETGAEAIVFDSERRVYHLLNATAYGIFQACSGSNTIGDIATALRFQFVAPNASVIIEDVATTVRELHEKRLIRFIVDYTQHSVQQELLDPSELHALSVSDPGMFPIIVAGDRVLLDKSTTWEPHVGDIVVYSNEGGHPVARRVLSVDHSSQPAQIVAQADVFAGPESPICGDAIMGRVVGIFRDRGVQWIGDLAAPGQGAPDESGPDDPPPLLQQMRVLDLREISAEAIANIAAVDDVSVVLLSGKNAHAWSKVDVRNAPVVVEVPDTHRVYTGQTELLPGMAPLLGQPISLLVVGQLFLTCCDPQDILDTISEVILCGQAYVNSEEAKHALSSVAKVLDGDITVAPRDHIRWAGESILGPEYVAINNSYPLISIGPLTISERLGDNVRDVPLLTRGARSRIPTEARHANGAVRSK